MPEITLLDSNGNVHGTAGLNWGTNIKNHTTSIDAYIPINMEEVNQNPGLFDLKGPEQTIVTLHWDDGEIMTAQFEGNSEGEYPKQLASTPYKNTMGIYLRRRFGIAHNEIFTMEHLDDYGRKSVTIDRIDATNYRMNLSV